MKGKRKIPRSWRLVARSVPASPLLFTRNERQLRMIQRPTARDRSSPDRSQAQELLPGLIDDVVRDNILPMLPWYQRPVMAAVSRRWRRCIASFDPGRGYLPHRPRGIILVFNSSSNDDVFADQCFFQLFDLSTKSWRELPPLSDVEDCFSIKGCLYGIRKDHIYRLDLPAGSWKWEPLPTTTKINNGVLAAVIEDGTLYLSGTLEDMIVIEKHDLDSRAVQSIVVNSVDSSEVAAHKQDMKQLFESFSQPRVTGRLRFGRTPDEASRNWIMAFAPESDWFLVATGKCALEMHGGSMVAAINLQRKLRLLVPHRIIALALDEGMIYVLLQADKRNHAKFSLWRGSAAAGCCPRALEKFSWERMESPVKFGDPWNRVSLRVLRGA